MGLILTLKHLKGRLSATQKDKRRPAGLKNPCTLCVTGPATKWQQASTIISFTGAVCLRTISVALGEEESADECSGLLSARSRGKRSTVLQ